MRPRSSLTNYFSKETPVTGGYCALVSGANGNSKPPTVTGVFLFSKSMKENYKGFTVPAKIWRSEELDMNAKFVACCLIDYFERGGVSAERRLPEYECKISNDQVKDILTRNNITFQRFFDGLCELGTHEFVTKLTIDIGGFMIIKTHF